MRIDYSRELNPEQYEAVTLTEGAFLIMAGAGSGKTRVITFRIAWMLDHGIPQNRILALTFTNKAAREMSGRVRQLTGRPMRELTVSTFHAFGASILRKEIRRLGWRENFTIYDETDRLQLIKECARETGFRMDSFDPRTAGAIFSGVESGLSDWSGENDAYRALYSEYKRSLRIFNAVDFDDLITLPIRLFDEHPDVREAYADRYRYLMVDEFQDTSERQYTLLRSIARNDVCAVGDDDQSIYSWRGASYANIERFERDFPSVRVIKLERNYRSTSTILSAANAVIANNPNRKEKRLWTPTGEAGSPIELVSPGDDREEAGTFARTIKDLRMREHLAWEDFGILMRTNALARQLEESLMEASVPYRLTGGTSFYDRKEVRDIVAYLRVIANPDDDVNLLRIVNTPRRGIGKTTVERIAALARSRNCSIRTALGYARGGATTDLPAKSIADIGDFLDMMDRYREEFLGRRTFAARLRSLVDDIGYWGYLLEEHRSNEKTAQWKFRTIEFLVQSIGEGSRHPRSRTAPVACPAQSHRARGRPGRDRQGECHDDPCRERARVRHRAARGLRGRHHAPCPCGRGGRGRIPGRGAAALLRGRHPGAPETRHIHMPDEAHQTAAGGLRALALPGGDSGGAYPMRRSRAGDER